MSDELPKLEKVRGRNPAPSKPDFFDASLLLIGGRTPLGEPNLKVGWGWDLTTFRNGNPKALKYPGPYLNRFILEKWLPPEFFGSPKQWNERRYQKTADGGKVDLLGEYPRQGHYGMVMPLTSADGGFIPLGNEVLTFIDWMQADFKSRTLNVYSDAKLYARLQEQMAEQEAAMTAEAEKASEEHGDYVRAHEHELNTNKEFSMPSIWTPSGEHYLN